MPLRNVGLLGSVLGRPALRPQGGLAGGLLRRDVIPQPTPITPPISGEPLNNQRGRRFLVPSLQKGGKVKRTGLYKVHKGETVIPESKMRPKLKGDARYKKLMKEMGEKKMPMKMMKKEK